MSATSSSCAGAKLPGPTAPERPYHAVALMTAVALVTTVFVRSRDVTLEVLDGAKTYKAGTFSGRYMRAGRYSASPATTTVW